MGIGSLCLLVRASIWGDGKVLEVAATVTNILKVFNDTGFYLKCTLKIVLKNG